MPRVAFPCIVEFAQANLVTLWTSAILILTASAAVYAGSWRSVKPSTQKAEDKPVSARLDLPNPPFPMPSIRAT